MRGAGGGLVRLVDRTGPVLEARRGAGGLVSGIGGIVSETGATWMAAAISDGDREARGIERLPGSLEEACDNLEEDGTLMQAMGDLLARSYLTLRRSEAKAYAEMSDDEQFRQHFYKY